MEVLVDCKFLGVQRIMKKEDGKETGEFFEILHAYDGTQNLVKPFLTTQQTARCTELKFGQSIQLKMEIWQGQKGMGTRVIDILVPKAA